MALGAMRPLGSRVAPGWTTLAWWDERIFTHSHASYQYEYVQPAFGFRLLGVANLNWFARRGA